MTVGTRIWVCVAHHTGFRCGGWASLVSQQGRIAGAAGGERNTTAGRMALAGLAWALRGVQSQPATAADGPIVVQTTSPDLAPLIDVLAGRLQPDDDKALWAEIAAAAAGRRLEVVRSPPRPETPLAFAKAWADLAMDKAKAAGAFTAAIPKANLAKAPGLGV
jgi:hypothetical protein